ncbi:MAG: glycosyltransferase [Pontixanthobacter sp.]
MAGAVLQWILALVPGILLLWFAAEIFAGLKSLPRGAAYSDRSAFDHTILIPAHDEAAVIADTVEALRIAAPSARILVVADNCTDDTAARAREAGAQCVERDDSARRGKGYALAFGRDHLADAPPHAVIVLDADCRITTGGPAELAAIARRTAGPVQAGNLLVARPDAPANVAISNFAMMVKNIFRARGLQRIGHGGLLFGTGMAFPWAKFRTLDLATGDATEDLALGLELVRGGVRVTLADHVTVTSPAASQKDSVGQRSRWEHGFLRNAGRVALPLLVASIRRPSRMGVAVGLHMMVPPLALLVATGLVCVAATAALGLTTGGFAPAIMLVACYVIAMAAVLAAWFAGGRAVLPGARLLAIPGYVLWKLPIYAAFFKRRQNAWDRENRQRRGD